MNDIAIQATTARAAMLPPATASEGEAFLAMVERLARDPNVNVDALERMLSMRERIMAQNAKAAYVAALKAVKPDLPIIEKRGKIKIPGKDGKPDQVTPFAKWEDIDEKIAPILDRHGLVLSFRSGMAADGKIVVTGVLQHIDGHSEETAVTLPHDSSGSKNAVQAVGSSLSYGKRYAATMLLNIRTKDEDDDGAAADAPGVISDAQRQKLQTLFDETSADVPKFCRFFKIEAVVDLPSSRFNEALTMLEAKRKR